MTTAIPNCVRRLCLAGLGFVVTLFAASVQAQEASRIRLDPELSYTAERTGEITYGADFSVIVTPPAGCKKLAVWLPVPPSDAAQEVSESRFSTLPRSVQPQLAREDVYGNTFAYFEFPAPLGAHVIRHQFRVKTWELNWRVAPEKVARVVEWPSGFDKYRRGDAQAVLLDGRFEKLLHEIVPRSRTPSADLNEVMHWVQTNFKYSHAEASLRANAEHALLKRAGHCSDYHSFCASLGRALGVPTRITYGLHAFPKQSPSHCKLEAFLPPYGWVSFDVSETQKLCQEIRRSKELSLSEQERLVALAQRRLASGFRDNTWFLQTRGSDYELAPKASRRVPVVRTAWIEADGRPLPEPDPSHAAEHGLSWMTAHAYEASREVAYPFHDWRTLEPIAESKP